MIVIVDYGMGNLRSVTKAVEHVGAEARVSSDPREVAKAEKLILPGVGAFGAAMQELARRQLIEPIQAAIGQGTPYLGICLGLQLLFQDSEEDPGVKGLGVLQGTVRRFPDAAGSMTLKVPHMGWNQVKRVASGEWRVAKSSQESFPHSSLTTHHCPVLAGIPDGSYVYFVHSYYADPADHSLILLEADYGVRFTAMVWQERLFATQFHPEKSQALGLRLLQNFVAL